MSRHDGVSCDSCMKGNFRGRRYKCLVCYDYDLCASCYEAGASTTRHLADHPMQCILTRSDFELYYGGEGVSIEQPQSLTCPYCTRMGFTETTLQEHVAADHPDTSFEVICPVCAYLPGGEPNLATDDIAGHLTLEHRSGPRDLITFLDDSASNRSSVRRIPHTARGVGSSRSRRSNMHFSSSGGLSPSSREGIDPIAELLSQLSGVRRAGAGGSGSGSAVQSSSAPSQLQQLQMQLQIERQQVRAARQQLERLPRRQTQVIGSVAGGSSSSGNHSNTMSSVVPSNAASNNNVASSVNPSSATASNAQNSTFLLPRCITSTPSDSQLQSIERESANRSLFTRELVVSTLVEALPDLTSSQQQVASSAPTPVSSVSTAMSSPETPNATSASSSSTTTIQQQQQTTLKKTQDSSKREQTNSPLSKQSTATQQQQHQVTATTASQGLPANPNNAAAAVAAAAAAVAANAAATTATTITPQSTAPVVQTLMHVIPQPLVLQQPLPIRNTGTGTIRQQIGVPAAAVAAYPQRGSSAAQSRRKPVRTVDGRNQSTEPPPPH